MSAALNDKPFEFEIARRKEYAVNATMWKKMSFGLIRRAIAPLRAMEAVGASRALAA